MPSGSRKCPTRRHLSRHANLSARVCVASICKLVYWNKIGGSEDLSFDTWPVTICTQSIQCLSIASFCFLFLKPLFQTLETGFIRSDELRRKGQRNPEGSFSLSGMSSGQKASTVRNLQTPTQTGNHYTTAIALDDTGGWDGGSQTSETHIIRETRTWAIESSAANESQVFA